MEMCEWLNGLVFFFGFEMGAVEGPNGFARSSSYSYSGFLFRFRFRFRVNPKFQSFFW